MFEFPQAPSNSTESPPSSHEDVEQITQGFYLSNANRDRLLEAMRPTLEQLMHELGVEKESGLWKLDATGFSVTVRTDEESFGSVYDPLDGYEGPVDPSRGKPIAEIDPNAPFVEISDEERKELAKQLGRGAMIPDILRARGIPENSGLVRFKTDEIWFYVDTAVPRYGVRLEFA